MWYDGDAFDKACICEDSINAESYLHQSIHQRGNAVIPRGGDRNWV